MPLISVVTPCYNEEGNIREVYRRVKEIFAQLPAYTYEHIFIDNASTDRTVEILREMAGEDQNLKVIVNARNFGHTRSPYYAMLQAGGEAVISLVADLQDPPEMIPEFLKQWEAGYKIVVGVKKNSQESPLMFGVRNLYYNLIGRLSDTRQIKNFTGFGLYDQKIMEVFRSLDDPSPYFRGMITEIGYEVCELEYLQPRRSRGITKNNFYILFDLAMLGITNHSKIPLRLATLGGFSLAVLSLLVALGYLIYKLIYWKEFSLGMAPLVIGLFFFSAVQLFFTGVMGEYIGSIHTRVMKRPLVIEKERIPAGWSTRSVLR